ncbi:response regulator [bacterium]|nr:MAG: response regulator [bacterium]
MSEQKAILIVDDEWMLVETISYHLEKAGYRILKAMDGDAGLQTALVEKPDLVVLDLMMPNLSGWDVCRELRKSPDFGPEIPIILMTARGEAEDRSKSLAAGASDYLLKPFGMQDLITKVKVLLGDE